MLTSHCRKYLGAERCSFPLNSSFFIQGWLRCTMRSTMCCNIRMSGCISRLQQGSLVTRWGTLSWAGNLMWISANWWGVQPQGSRYLYTIHPWLYYLGSADYLRGVSAIGLYSTYSWWCNMMWSRRNGSQYSNTMYAHWHLEYSCLLTYVRDSLVGA